MLLQSYMSGRRHCATRPSSGVPNLLASESGPRSIASRSAWREEVPLNSANGDLPKPGQQVRQDYGLGATTGESNRARGINSMKRIVRQSYGLGPARICFKPHKGWASLVDNSPLSAAEQAGSAGVLRDRISESGDERRGERRFRLRPDGKRRCLRRRS